jgi:hypothetical protein
LVKQDRWRVGLLQGSFFEVYALDLEYGFLVCHGFFFREVKAKPIGAQAGGLDK